MAAGYDDGESWWSNVIEENPAPGPVFAAVADAMAALRAESGTVSAREAARETKEMGLDALPLVEVDSYSCPSAAN